MAVSIANAPKFCHGGAHWRERLKSMCRPASLLRSTCGMMRVTAMPFSMLFIRLGLEAKMLPTIVWVHGGAFVSAQQRLHCQLSKTFGRQNFTVIGVNYSLAPGKTYPTPIRQVNTP